MPENHAPIGVVCDDRLNGRHVVSRLLAGCGFALGGTADDYLALRELVRATHPAVAVITLPLPGMNGLRAVRELHADAPECRIVLLSSFGQLELAAVEAGATALVHEDDLRGLQLVLRDICAADVAPVIVTLPDPRGQALLPAAVRASSSSPTS